MAETPAYVIVGRGRWSGRMRMVLEGEKKSVSVIEEARQRPVEGKDEYISRLSGRMKASGANIVWLCVVPGPHIPLMIRAALGVGLNVVVEKPWYGPESETADLLNAAKKKKNLFLAIHYEYLMHAEVKAWKENFYPGTGLQFGARFWLNRTDRSGISPMDNLGTHMMSIREFAVPSAELARIECAYDRPDERRVWLERDAERVAEINLLQGSERLIQDFVQQVEGALSGGAFPIDLAFGLRVAQKLAAYKARVGS